MKLWEYYHLCIRYPTLKLYLNTCYANYDDDYFYDFLFTIETQDMDRIES
jgi:hypothetical protein